MGKHTIFLSIPYTMSARNILRSDIFGVLRGNFKVVILTPLHGDEDFHKEFGGGNVVIKDLPRGFSFVYKAYRRILDIVEGCYFTGKTKIETLLILEECLRKTRPCTYWSRRAIGGALAPLLGLMRGYQGRFLRNPYYEGVLAEFKPVFVFLTHPIALEEFPLAFCAKRHGIPLIAMIHSWDNITAKSGIRTVTSNRPGRMLPVKFDKVIVWNNIIRQELVDYYGYDKEDIFIAGVPQFDFYSTNRPCSRELFFKKIGGDPGKRLILYAAGNFFMLPKQDEVIEVLVKAMDEGRVKGPSQLLIRAHPGTNMEALRERFSRHRDVLFVEPGIANAAMACSKGWRNGDESQNLLAETLSYSDVTINVSSTMSLDAAVFDRPIVCIGFDGYENLSYHSSVLKHYDFTHYRHVMRTGGVRLAKTSGELIRYVNEYLEDPGLDADGRCRIREELCYRLDGKAGERIGNFVSDFVKGLR